jgi:hypothetical protein
MSIGARSVAFARLKIAVLAPMPSASVAIAAVKPGPSEPVKRAWTSRARLHDPTAVGLGHERGAAPAGLRVAIRAEC